IILCNPTTPAECVSDQRKHTGRRYHTAGASRRRLPDSASTRRDQRRDTRPFGSVSTAAEAPVVAIQAPVGTPNPVFTRLTILSGKESEGAFASAVLPAPGASPPITGASFPNN